MLFFCTRTLRFLLASAVGETSPRQLAWGIALGVWVGLVPKENLLAVALMVLVASLRINLALCCGVALIVSFLAVALDPAAHQLGLALLTHSTLMPMWDGLYRQPFAPWTNFNNTVVLGQFIIGLALASPLAFALTPICEKLAPKVYERLERYRVGRWLFGVEWAERLGGVPCDGPT